MKTMKLIVIACAAALTCSGGAAAIAATTVSNTKSALIQVNKNCQFSTILAPDLDFGSVTPTIGDSGAISTSIGAAVRCTKNTTFSVALTKATSMGGTVTPGNTDTVPYAANITAGASGTGSGMTAGSPTTVTVSGTVNKVDYDVTPDNYADATLKLTITY